MSKKRKEKTKRRKALLVFEGYMIIPGNQEKDIQLSFNYKKPEVVFKE